MPRRAIVFVPNIRHLHRGIVNLEEGIKGIILVFGVQCTSIKAASHPFIFNPPRPRGGWCHPLMVFPGLLRTRYR